jgi:tetratricopeptide (TPR) repeat protein
LADLVARRGDFDEARALATEALELRRSSGSPGGIGHALAGLGTVEFTARDYARAGELYEEALKLSEQSGSRPDILVSVVMVGECARRVGNLTRAVECLRRSLDLVIELNQRDHLAEVLREIAALARDPATATRLLAAAERIDKETNLPQWDPDDIERTTNRLRSRLGTTFAELWTEGLSLTDEAALSAARAALDSV